MNGSWQLHWCSCLQHNVFNGTLPSTQEDVQRDPRFGHSWGPCLHDLDAHVCPLVEEGSSCGHILHLSVPGVHLVFPFIHPIRQRYGPKDNHFLHLKNLLWSAKRLCLNSGLTFIPHRSHRYSHLIVRISAEWLKSLRCRHRCRHWCRSASTRSHLKLVYPSDLLSVRLIHAIQTITFICFPINPFVNRYINQMSLE